VRGAPAEHREGPLQRGRVLTHALATIGADLAIDAAREGRRDEAIDDLRALVSLHMGRGFRVFVGCAGEALVRLLIDRGSVADLDRLGREVRHVVLHEIAHHFGISDERLIELDRY
jgi:adenylate cyclase